MKTIMLLLILIFFSINTYSQEGNIVITTFKQGHKNNCVSVALIKAAIDVFGVNNVFKDSIVDDSVHRITLKNSTTFKLYQCEIKMAANSCGFIPLDTSNAIKKEIYEYAKFCFAVIVKNFQTMKNDKQFSYCDATRQVNSGLTTKIAYKYLGLDNNVKHLKRWTSKVKDKKGIVAWSPWHAVYVTHGYYDKQGKATNFKIIYRKRFQIVKKNN